MKKLLLLLIVCMAMLNACKKKTVVNNVDSDLKAAFNFQVGTYWIYKDSITGNMDSFFVIGNNLTQDDISSNAYNSIYYQIRIDISEHNIYPLPASIDTEKWQLAYESNDIFSYLTDTNIYTGNIEYSPLINYPFSYSFSIPGGGINNSTPDIVALANIFSSYSINGQNYTNVAEVNHSLYMTWNGYLPAPFSYNDWFYITPNIGLVKIVLNHPQDAVQKVWELQRYKIVK